MAQRALPGSVLREALEYIIFLSNAWVPLDNNLVERQLRDRVLERRPSPSGLLVGGRSTA